MNVACNQELTIHCKDVVAENKKAAACRTIQLIVDATTSAFAVAANGIPICYPL
jgi:hypothetical protein